MSSFVERPLCGVMVEQEELEAHVQEELAAQEGGNDGGSGAVASSRPPTAAAATPPATTCTCPECGLAIELADLDSHLLAHELAADAQGSGAASAAGAASGACGLAGATARCERCGVELPLAEVDSHLLAHELEGDIDDAASAAAAAAAAADEAEAAELERRAFLELQQRYGFAAKPERPGTCHLCHQEGHWVRECPQNPDVQAAKAMVIPSPTPAAVAAAQQPARSPLPALPPGTDGGDVVTRLVEVLRAQTVPASCQYQAALCAPGVVHYGVEPYDAGWGCGYRNIQMQIAHLLALRHGELAPLLFGGAGFVPAIAALQAWLEVAWAEGFDPQGCEQLGGRVQGGHKWIGTTEAAALLRHQGLRAKIADFGAEDRALAAQHTATASAAPAAAGVGATAGSSSGLLAVELHPGVQCDGCSAFPLTGARYHSQNPGRPDFDLCAKCYAAQGGERSPNGPFQRMLAGRYTEVSRGGQSSATGGASGTACGSGGELMRDRLLRWIWRYFSSSQDNAPSSADAGSSAATAGGMMLGGGAYAAAAAAGSAGLPAPKRARPAAAAARGKVTVSTKPCLYLQHEGHSRTVIGIERRVGRDGKEDFSLLVLDPGVHPATLAAALREGHGWQRHIKRGAHTLRQAQFQVLWVESGLASSEEERQALKLMAASERH